MFYSQGKQGLELVNEDVQAALIPWIGKGELLHLWLDTGVVYLVVKHFRQLRFLRAFSIGSQWHVSVDQEIELDNE